MRIGSLLRWLACITAGLGLFAATLEVKADTRLAQLCSKANTGTAVCTGTTSYDYPSSNSLVLSQGTKWYFFSTVRATDFLSVCSVDIPRGSNTCPSTALVTKELVPLKGQTEPAGPIPSPVAGTFDVVVNWQPPTTGTKDGKTVPLVEGDVIGYSVGWIAGDKSGDQVLPATQTSLALTLPATKASITLKTQGKDAWSDGKTITTEPKLLKPGTPASVTITFGEPK